MKMLAWNAIGSEFAAVIALSSRVNGYTQVTGPNTSRVETLASRGGLTMFDGTKVVLLTRPAPMSLAPAATASSVQPETRSASRGWISGPTPVFLSRWQDRASAR